MAYWSTYLIQADLEFRQRLYACAAEQKKGESNPKQWVDDHIWTIAATAGWSGKWESAMASSIVNPGRTESVISDYDILVVIQSLT